MVFSAQRVYKTSTYFSTVFLAYITSHNQCPLSLTYHLRLHHLFIYLLTPRLAFTNTNESSNDLYEI